MVINLKIERDDLVQFFDAVSTCIDADMHFDFLTPGEAAALIFFVNEVGDIAKIPRIRNNCEGGACNVKFPEN